MNSEQILKVLDQLADKYSDYPGTIERNDVGVTRLRYVQLSEGMIAELVANWNRAVRALDQIAPRIIPLIQANGIQIVEGETSGATVMNWLLLDKWRENRLSCSVVSNAFFAISMELRAVVNTQEVNTPVANVAEQVDAPKIGTDQQVYERVLALFDKLYPKRGSHKDFGLLMSSKVSSSDWTRYYSVARTKANINDDPSKHFESKSKVRGAAEFQQKKAKREPKARKPKPT